MNLLSLPQAQQFVQSFGLAPTARGRSVEEILLALNKASKVKAGTQQYGEFRDALLRHAEAGLLLSTSNFRRSLEMIHGSSASWAHVTLYYSAWYSAQSISAMLGGLLYGKWSVEVVSDHSGSYIQVSKLHQPGGQHERFWQAYFGGIQSFRAWIPANLRYTVDPYNQEPTWMSDARNVVSYRLLRALEAGIDLNAVFDTAAFPNCLSGSLGIQYEATIGLLELAFWLCREVRLQTGVLTWLGNGATRKSILESILSAPSIALPEPRVQLALF